MPSQVPIDNKMIGVGSCGIGVIMAARDFIRNGPATGEKKSGSTVTWISTEKTSYYKSSGGVDIILKMFQGADWNVVQLSWLSTT